ncbi:MAG TPA: histidine phosphatase family protein [Anaerolineae bacterium]
MELYIIRHAQSTNNALADQTDRVTDPPLTRIGEQQAERLAEHLESGWQPITWSPVPVPPNMETRGMLRGYGLTDLYCSPMLRSLQTAQAISRSIDLTPEVWIDIHEQGGMFLEEGEGADRVAVGKPGLTRSQILARFPGYVLPDGITERGWYNRDYEDWPACHVRAARVAETFFAWAATGNSRRIAIVSHGGFVDALLKAFLRAGPPAENNDGDRRYFYLHFNTAMDRIDFDPEGRLRVAYLNRVVHLPPEMIT